MLNLGLNLGALGLLGGVEVPRRCVAGDKIMLTGDSLVSKGTRFNASGRALDTVQVNVPEIANAMLGQLFRCQSTENGTLWAGGQQGIGGYNGGQIGTQFDTLIPAAAASGIKGSIFWAGDNDLNDVDTTFAQLASDIRRLKVLGPVIVIGLSPRDVVVDPLQGWVDGDARFARRVAVNAKLALLAGPNVYFVPYPSANYLSPADGNVERVAPLKLKDDAHNASCAAFVIAQALVPALQWMFPAGGSWLPAFSDALNLHPNGTLSGTTGTRAGVYATLDPSTVGGGNGVATGWTIERISGDATITCGKDASDFQYLNITAVSTDYVFRFRHSTTTGSLPAFNALSSSAYGLLATKLSRDSHAMFDQTHNQIYESGGSLGYRGMSDSDSTKGGFEAAINDWTIASNPAPHIASTFRARGLVIMGYATDPRRGTSFAGQTAKVTVKGVGLYQVSDPTVEFNLPRIAQL